MNRCQQCNSELHRNASFCPACGALQPGLSESIECEHHNGEQAVGLCVLCGKPVCGDCAVTADGKIFCENTHHQAVFQQWVVVHESEFEFESDMIQRNIAAAGIETKVFSFREHLGTHWMSDVRPVRVMVPQAQQQKAIGILQNLRLLNGQEEK